MKKFTLLALIALFLMPVFTQAQTAMVPAGSGTSSDPYQISTLNNLYWVTQNSSSWGSYFVQTADIDATDTKNWDSGSGFLPIGNGNTTNFTGTYNGKGHTIDNLYINRSSSTYVGLFGLTFDSEIDSLGVINENISGYNGVGGLVGYSAYHSTISSSYSTGSVNCSGNFVGGLVGINDSTTISKSFSTGDVRCVSGSREVGGLVGYSGYHSTISSSYSTGSVSGSDSVGGLVGVNIAYSSISNSYSRGSVSGSGAVGGLVGYNYSADIYHSYSTGSVNGSSHVGGLVGLNYSPIGTASFWDMQTSKQNTSGGGTGENTADMKTESTFTGAGWDFSAIWGMNASVNDGYPFLLWQNPLSTGIPETTAQSQTLVYAYGQNVYIKSKDNSPLRGTVSINNLMGQVVFHAPLNGSDSQEIDTRLDAGVYVVLLKMNNNLCVIQKVILEKF